VEPVGRGSARRAKTPADPRAEPPGGVDELPAPDPGQWFQSESGLHQNWMRDYDPTTGRYLQADPPGLVAGMNVYGYAPDASASKESVHSFSTKSKSKSKSKFKSENTMTEYKGDIQLTEEELLQIEQRANLASLGPWKSWVEGRDFFGDSSIISKGVGDNRGVDIEPLGATAEDMDFIAAARQDIPRLIFEIRLRRRMVVELEAKL
jgi:hypothetical protein